MPYQIITNPKLVQQYFIDTDEDMLREYAEAEPELDRELDFVITDHNKGFIAGASVCCGFDPNSRGSNFTLLPNALFVDCDLQGQGYGSELVRHIEEKAMAIFSEQAPTNEFLIDCAFASSEGAHCCYKLYSSIKARLSQVHTKVMMYVSDFGMVKNIEDLKQAIKLNPFCD